MSFSFVPGQSEQAGVLRQKSEGITEAFQGPNRDVVFKRKDGELLNAR
jgi:hypothetical protein